MNPFYFDHAATTPVDPRVLREMVPFFSEAFGNANSIHEPGRRARAAVELARERVASLLGAEDPSQIVFTSGATEGNNWVLRNFPGAVVGPFEHSSVRETAERLGQTTLSHDGLALGPAPSTPLLSLMLVNNETGDVWKPNEYKGAADRVHSDVTQAAGKLPLNVSEFDYATCSAHKFYGPKGVGAVYMRDETLQPLLTGGEQESGFRSGTLNVPGIVGMGTAAAIAQDERERDYDHARELGGVFLEGLEPLSDWRINGGDFRSPCILSIAFFGVEGETLVIEADQAGYSVSSGAACSNGSTRSHVVLERMGVPQEWRRGSIRISFGRGNTTDSAAHLAQTLVESVKKLRRMT